MKYGPPVGSKIPKSGFLAYASSRGQALIGRRLYLPEHTWCQDPDRRSGSGIPEKVEFATKPRLAASLPRDTWHRQSAGAGAKGPRYYDWTWVQTGADKNRFLLTAATPQPANLPFTGAGHRARWPWPR
ncbi:transposase [Streptomyces sp. RLB1-33]|nr:transposase [Streptomyces sp. RLB1-33]QIY75594.1 transposase [Streptomyces sp. RLB1-33]